MILGEEARIELSLYANNYLAGLNRVEGETKNSGKSIEDIFERVTKGIEASERQCVAIGNEAKSNAQQQRILENAIKGLLREGLDPADESVKKLREQLDKLRTTTSVTMSSTFAKMRDVMQGPIAAFETVTRVAGKVGAALDGLVESAAKSDRAQSNLNAVLESTNAVSGMTISALNSLSSEMARLTLNEDDAVTQAQAVLLTFTNIGDKIFPAASMAAADMAQVMGTDLQSAIVTIGKALNAPIEGITLLKRVGVQLTDEQKMQIESFMKMNDVASAQKIIIDELAVKFGGAAKAAAESATGGYAQMKKALDEINESVGKWLSGSGVFKFYVDGIKDIAFAIGGLVDEKLVKRSFSAIIMDSFNTKEFDLGKVKLELDKVGKTYGDFIAYAEEQKRLMGKGGDWTIAALPTLDDIIIRLKDRERYETKIAAEAAKAAAALAQQQAIEAKNAAAIKLVSDAQSAVTEKIRESELAQKYANGEIMTAEEKAKLYGAAIVSVLTDTSGLVSETNKLLDPLKQARDYWLGLTGDSALSKLNLTFIDFSNHIGEVNDTEGIPATIEQLIELEKATNPAAWALQELDATFIDFSNHIGEVNDTEGIPATTEQLIELEKAVNIAAWALQEFDSTFIDFSSHVGENTDTEGIPATTEQLIELEKATNPAAWALQELDATFIDFSNHIGENQDVPTDGLTIYGEGLENLTTDYDIFRTSGERAYNAIAEAADKAGKIESESAAMALQANRDMATGIIDSYTMMSAAMGQALVASEEGWKSLGRTTLNVIAAGIEGLAKEAMITAGLLMTNVLSGDLMELPALLKAGATIGLAYGAASAVRAIPMAEGGSGWVDRPTHFVAGEAGREFVSFTPEKKARGITIIQNINGSVIAERQLKSLAIAGVAEAGKGW